MTPDGCLGCCATSGCKPYQQRPVIGLQRRPMDAQGFEAGGAAEIDAEFSFGWRRLATGSLAGAAATRTGGSGSGTGSR